MLDTNQLFAIALGLNNPWYISSINFSEENKVLEIHLDFKSGSYFTYIYEDRKVKSYKAYDTVEKSWRDLNFFEHECFLIARVSRIKNQEGNLQTYSPDWSGIRNGFTLLFEAIILQLAKSMPISKIVEERKTVFVAEGKSSETVKQFKSDFSDHNRNVENITDISCNISPAFIKGVQENLPNAQITFDKFHVLKIINEAVDCVRRQEVKDNPILKGKRYIFLKNDANLTDKQRNQKNELKISDLNLKSMDALNMRETFQQIYHAETKSTFVNLLEHWYQWVSHCDLPSMVKAAEMVRNHWDGIVNWKESNINNGILEGLNSVVQAAKRKARGYKMKHLKTIAYLVTSNLNFGKINYGCLPT